MHFRKLVSYWFNQLFFPGTYLQKQYRAFKSLLENDKQAHLLIAQLEEIYHNRLQVDTAAVEKTYLQLSACVSQVIADLLTLSPVRYGNLADYFKKFDDYIRLMLATPAVNCNPPYVLLAESITAENGELAGGKAYNLSTVKTALGLPIPEGFVVTTRAYHRFFEVNNLRKPINLILADLDLKSLKSLKNAFNVISQLIQDAEIPEEVGIAIQDAFGNLQSSFGENIRFAVRSSAVGEDSKISFAGQYRSVLNVGEEDIFQAYKKVIASKYSPGALYYRICHGLTDVETPMAVQILKMIPAEASGVVYTREPESGDASSILIHSIPGLGEMLVNGGSTPDIIKVSKENNHQIECKTNGNITEKMVLSASHNLETISIPAGQKHCCSLDDESTRVLTKWAVKLERFFGGPQDIEWCKDQHGQLYLLQSRPLSTEKQGALKLSCEYQKIPNQILLDEGETASSGCATGKVFKINQDSDLESLPAHSILVAKNPQAHYVAVMDKLSGVVTDQGSKAGHFASVAREFGIPVLVNSPKATEILDNGMDITVHADRKMVFAGSISEYSRHQSPKSALLADNPFKRRLKFIISFISPLQLVDPDSATFRPEGCRSLHDIIRYSHEMALREMFNIGDKRSPRIRSSRLLETKIPIRFYLLDLGKGLSHEQEQNRQVGLEQIRCFPLKHLLNGLHHPDILWSGFSHFNWEEYDNIVMAGGMISKNSGHLASYAMISDDYLNLNLRFGYHFVIVDCLATRQAEKNHVTFRFTGGGGVEEGKLLRTRFLDSVLQKLGFKVDVRGELVDARLKEVEAETLSHILDMIGRLLGATRLMDMYLKDKNMADRAVEEFFQGRYDFSPADGANQASN